MFETLFIETMGAGVALFDYETMGGWMSFS